MSDPLLVPEGTRLVHIGPHKTGSTALQSAFHESRESLLAQGVRYAGQRRHEVAAARWVTGRTMAHHDRAVGARRWRELADGIRAAGEPRVVLSSEFLSDAKDDEISQIVEDVGPDHVGVAVTLRPLTNILPSQWQQYVQRGLRTPYDVWLSSILGDGPGRRLTPSFWVRHRHDVLIRRWGEVVGADKVVVIVLDAADHDFLPRSFERLLGLSTGTLDPHEEQQNRSLTLAEAELVRRFNQQFFAAKLTHALHGQLMRSGAGSYLKQRIPGRDEVKITTPQWALDRAAEIGREMAAAIADSGAVVVGDLDRLSQRSTTITTSDEPPTLDPSVAARLATGLVVARRNIDASVPPPLALADATAQQRLAGVTARELAAEIAGRGRRRLTGRRGAIVRPTAPEARTDDDG